MKSTKMIALLLGCMLCFSACGQKADSNPNNNAGTTAENNYDGPKDFKGWTTSMATFNPHMYTNSKSFYNYGTLVAMMASENQTNELKFVPHHASELPKSEDGGITWTVKLRDNLKWTDGTPINAKTYEYTMKMLLDPKLANKNAAYMFDTCIVKNAKNYFTKKASWEDVGVKVVDDSTLKITLEYASTELDFWTTIGTLIWPVHEQIYEKCMNADRTSTTYGTTLDTTPSCGMFKLTEWITDGHDKFERNDDDPLVKEGYVKLDSVNRRYISQNATRAELFFSGELDQHSLTGDDYLKYKNDPRAYKTLSPNVWGFFLNGASKNTIMQNQKFRQAIYYGAPREEICENVYKLYPAAANIIANGIYVGDPLSGGQLYRDTDEAKKVAETYKTNQEKAKKLFDEAYAENGSKPVSVEYIYFEGQEDQKRQAEILQETFEKLFGKDKFTFTLRSMPPSSAYDVYRSGNYDMGLGVRLANVFNPWATFNVWTSGYADKYITGFSSEEFDKLQYECVYGSLVNDPEGRTKALARMEELLLEYAAFCPMMQNDNTVMYSDRITLANTKYLPFIGYSANQIDITKE